MRFSTVSDLEIEPLYTPEDVTGDYESALGYPGEYPYTRGVYESMYRGRLWTMRQFAGFGLAEDTNERFHFLLAQGQDGLSTAFDMPTLMGYDADHERARGEVGREGVSVTSIHDMARLFDRIPLDKVSTSMTINCSASVLLAMYLVVAERQGVPWDKVGGTIQNDMLKEFIAQKEWICPPRPVAADRHRHDRVLREARCRDGIRCRSPATTSARPARPRCRNSRSPSPTASATSRKRSSAASTSTISRRACRSSGTCTTISSRRSPSCARRAGCGRGS